MFSCLCVGLGGAVGSVLRYLIGTLKLSESTVFPYKTLIINVLGSFLIGLIASLVLKRHSIEPNLVLFLKVGICGGFTTFSTFALESVQLMQSGKTFSALVYMLLSIILSLTAVCCAQAIVR